MRRDGQYHHGKMLAVACRHIIVLRLARLCSNQIDDHISLSSGIQKIWSPAVISVGSIYCSNDRRGSDKMSLSWRTAVLQRHLPFFLLPRLFHSNTRPRDIMFLPHTAYILMDTVMDFISWLVGCIGARSLLGYASPNLTSWHSFSCQKTHYTSLFFFRVSIIMSDAHTTRSAHFERWQIAQ